MIRGQISIPEDDFEAFKSILNAAPEWLRQAQEQLVSLPPFIHYKDLETTTFPDSDDSTVLYLPFDMFIKDGDWHSLRGGKSYAVGDAIPSAFETIDYTEQPIGMTRVLYNNTGATIVSGDIVAGSGLRGVKIQATGSDIDVGSLTPAGSQWYAFVKLSAGEAGDFVRVA